ncbi:hypothetical protein HY413_02320 [Candidatus Kaiserbacteria bacterium]|nr:hypothetical protein [Candidatus Kaiserbacteria bacterium]
MSVNEKREEAQALRLQGKTYPEICHALGIKVPKSTMFFWFRRLIISEAAKNRIALMQLKNLERGRSISLQKRRVERARRERAFIESNLVVCRHMSQNHYAQKIALAMLYLAEGGKRKHGSMVFGNSDPHIVLLFLSLLRACFSVDESRLRVTLQCRADQNVKKLERFWLRTTKVPATQFYKAQIDQRTVGKPTKKKEYKGVCRIDYFSADADFDLKCLANQLEKLHYQRWSKMGL